MDKTQIDFIRHTRLKGVDGTFCYGITDIDVADTFPEEAAAVREQIAGRVYDAVFTSPLRRARKLADFCGYGETARVDRRLAEHNFGEWEMKPWDELFREIRRRDDLTPAQRLHPELVTPPGGEGLCAMRDRVAGLLREVASRTEWRRVAFFCHGGVVNMGRWIAGEVDEGHLFSDVPAYGSVTTLAFGPEDFGTFTRRD